MLSFLLFVFAVAAAISSVDTTCGLNVLGSLESTKVSKMKYAVVYIFFCTLGGLLTGLIIGGANLLLKGIQVDLYYKPVIIIIFLIFIGLELWNKAGLLPSGNFIVPSVWIKDAGYRTAALWGNILGMGFITLQAGVLFHCYVLISLFSAPWWLSVVAGFCFGIVRGMVFSLPFIRSVVYQMLEKRVFRHTALTAMRLFASYILLVGSIILIFMN
ncbi:hypothetical protein J45TS6_12510 [Paenibacillus sp. J45TS6]|uniref:hypothetical protein n=1 Tax=unclassified Paenibacillus TaxID=185978 RepID=UPI001B06D47D|nr:hypothetical protein [Paenibacillus sp. J45TS6]GIP42792.1 hypothetical protein J45TS6_12510 [Paenibacillus sp. J45TS6]